MASCASEKSEPKGNAAGEFVGAGAPDCPGTEPSVGSACAKESVACEYGGDFNPACNSWFTCAQGGWRTTTLNGVKNPTCPTASAPKAEPNAAACPASAPRTSDACGSALECTYADTSCTCANGYWNCSASRLFCEAPRPRIGTPCKPFDECVIQITTPCDRIVLTCGRENTWVASKSICL